MAKRHVNQYFLEVENQYFEMLTNLQEANRLLAENNFSEEVYLQMDNAVQNLKTNYERLAYVMFLLNKPNKKDKKEAKIFESWYKRLKFASKEAILNENKDVLAHVKQLLREGKIGTDEQ